MPTQHRLFSRQSIGGAFSPEYRRHAEQRATRPRRRSQTMVEDTVVEHLRAMSGNEWVRQIHSCKVSDPLQPPWGRSYRLVEWTMKHTPESSRRVVPAESTALEIAQAVVSHVPGRRFCQQGDE
jgi:hypothetical protein